MVKTRGFDATKAWKRVKARVFEASKAWKHVKTRGFEIPGKWGSKRYEKTLYFATTGGPVDRKKTLFSDCRTVKLAKKLVKTHKKPAAPMLFSPDPWTNRGSSTYIYIYILKLRPSP